MCVSINGGSSSSSRILVAMQNIWELIQRAEPFQPNLTVYRLAINSQFLDRSVSYWDSQVTLGLELFLFSTQLVVLHWYADAVSSHYKLADDYIFKEKSVSTVWASTVYMPLSVPCKQNQMNKLSDGAASKCWLKNPSQHIYLLQRSKKKRMTNTAGMTTEGQRRNIYFITDCNVGVKQWTSSLPLQGY